MNMPKTKSGCSSYDFENVIENLATFVCADCFEEVHQQFFGNLQQDQRIEFSVKYHSDVNLSVVKSLHQIHLHAEALL